MSDVKLWVDDLRTPPDDTWMWAKTSDAAIVTLAALKVDVMSLDHDLGGQGMGSEETSRPIVLWLCEHEDRWPADITIHSWNPVGAEWLKGMCERYSPHQDHVPYAPSEQHWSGVEPPKPKGLDTVGWYIATLHQMVGHEAARKVIGGEAYDRELCILCQYEKGLVTQADVIERLAT